MASTALLTATKKRSEEKVLWLQFILCSAVGGGTVASVVKAMRCEIASTYTYICSCVDAGSWRAGGSMMEANTNTNDDDNKTNTEGLVGWRKIEELEKKVF